MFNQTYGVGVCALSWHLERGKSAESCVLRGQVLMCDTDKLSLFRSWVS